MKLTNPSITYFDCVILYPFLSVGFAFVLCTCTLCLSFLGATNSSLWLTVPQVK